MFTCAALLGDLSHGQYNNESNPAIRIPDDCLVYRPKLVLLEPGGYTSHRGITQNFTRICSCAL